MKFPSKNLKRLSRAIFLTSCLYIAWIFIGNIGNYGEEKVINKKSWDSLIKLARKYDFKLIKNLGDSKCDTALKAHLRSNTLRDVRELYPDDPLLIEAELVIAQCYRFRLERELPRFNDTFNYKNY